MTTSRVVLTVLRLIAFTLLVLASIRFLSLPADAGPDRSDCGGTPASPAYCYR